MSMAKQSHLMKMMQESYKRGYTEGFFQGEELGIQLLTDCLIITLGDADDMAKITGGSRWAGVRIMRLVGLLRQNWRDVRKACLDSEECGEYRERLDRKLKTIVPAESFTSWEERYDMLEGVTMK